MVKFIFNVNLKVIIYFIALLNFNYGQTNITNHKIYLLSNIVDISKVENFNYNINEILSNNNEPFTIILNGDLVDNDFDKNFDKDSIRILTILKNLSKYKNDKVIVIPGDRDWDDSGKKGLKNIKKLEQLIKSLKIDNVVWAIKDGCPGPKEILLNDNLLLIAINSQWWNHPFEVPGSVDGDCKVSTTDDFKEELEDILNENVEKNILIAGHYPIISSGEYGGHIPFYKHIFPLVDLSKNLYFPLPILGSLYASFRENIGNSYDIINERFEPFKKLLKNIISDYNSVIYLSGHEKNQQIIRSKGNYFINSGAPEHAEYASNLDGTVLSKSEPGIIEIIYHSDGKVSSTFHQFNNKEIDFENNFTLFESACKYPESDIPVNYSFIPCLDLNKIETETVQYLTDTTSQVAGPEYEAGSMKRFFFGDHYRDSWTKEIKVSYLNLDTTKGGLKVLKKGGGRQTLSLKFTGSDGNTYTFRSVNKNPIKALDYELRNTFVADIVKDQTSTQHPYGALAADVLLNEIDIIHAHPKLYVMPDDSRLGPYRNIFGNMLGMLEENPQNPPVGEKGFFGADEVLRSNKLFRKLFNDHNNKVDSKSFAVARAFDILVGDWGKHEDNWKWLGFKEGDTKIYKPMPRDRDHVFSRWDGVLPWLADREWAKESGENFDYEISGLRSLMFQARHLDRFIASDLSKEDWLNAAYFVQKRITNKTIEKAVRNMPIETYDISGKEIESKLKQRIKDLDKYVIDYYDMISTEVDIVGSNKDEYFDVEVTNGGSVIVNIFDIKNQSKGSKHIYSRKFYPDETEDIRMYGLNGNDIFNIDGNFDTSIKLRIIGGTGKDSINNESSSEILVYDKGNKTILNSGVNVKRINPKNESLFNYNRTKFAYNTYFPLPYISYGSDDGVIFSFAIDFVNHNFDKSDYSSKHHFKVSASTSSSFGIEYKGRFHQFLGNWDLVVKGHYDNPLRYTYFYGFGNETVKDDEKYLQNYYRTKYASKGLGLGLVYDYWKKSSFFLNFNYENNERQLDIDKTIFSTENFIGINKINLYQAAVGFDMDFRDNSVFPTSGMRIFTEYQNGIITNLDNRNYGKIFAISEGYLTPYLLIPFTLGLKAGGGKSFGVIPFYNQFTLGQNNYLKGFRNNRFTGQSILFMQSEIRINLFNINGSFVPMKVGILGFFNSGKIIQEKIKSDKWHNGYGFGLFLIPLREEFTIHTNFGFSKEESLLFEFGIGSAL